MKVWKLANWIAELAVVKVLVTNMPGIIFSERQESLKPYSLKEATCQAND